MSLSFVIDMNLSPEWTVLLRGESWPTLHWSDIGAVAALDGEIMEWAREHAHAVLTQDLDFGTLLAMTGADSPSVVLIRGADVLPETRGPEVVRAVRQNQAALAAGALVVVDIERFRVRVLPLLPRPQQPDV